MVVGDGGGGVKKCNLGVGWVGSVVWEWGYKKRVFYVWVELRVWWMVGLGGGNT